MSLEGKNCLITGATGSLGSKLATMLDALGCNLYLTGTKIDKLVQLSESLCRKSHFSAEDLSHESGAENLAQRVSCVLDIDILINSAGAFSIDNIEDVSKKKFDKYMSINVRSPYRLCRYFCSGMKERRWGKIINVGSSSSYSGFKGGSLYCMTKHALLGMSRALFEELKEYNVQVSCVSPGSMQSEMAKISTDQDFSTFLRPEDVAAQIVNVLSMENNMVCNELRLNRMIMR